MFRAGALLSLTLVVCGCHMLSGLDDFRAGYEGCLTELRDDFSDPLDLKTWTPYGHDAMTIDGVLQLSWLDEPMASASVTSIQPQNVRDCAALVEVTGPPPEGGVRAGMFLGSLDNRMGMFVQDGELHMVVAIETGEASVDESTDFNPMTMHWWRLREEGGEVFWDTSPDGLAWTTRHQAPRPPPPFDAVPLTLGGSSPDDKASAVTFDNVNNPPGSH